MNRKILFRAKSIYTGQWVYGYYSCDSGRYHFIKSVDDYYDYQVDPATVGQFTGAIDKNGNKIFEGDIVKTDYHIERVVYEEIEWRLYISNNSYCGLSNHIGNGYYIEVLGNIHDNPELLKGASDD